MRSESRSYRVLAALARTEPASPVRQARVRSESLVGRLIGRLIGGIARADAVPADRWAPDTRSRARRPNVPDAISYRRAPQPEKSYREVFAIREFRALWSAQLFSFAGDQFAMVAITILVYQRTNSPFLTALAYALIYLSPIIGGPLLSGLADRMPYRRVMITCDVIRSCLVGLMALPVVPLPVLCVLLFCTVLLGMPFSSARRAMLPDVLPYGKLMLGYAIDDMTLRAGQVIGFVAGAAIVADINPRYTLALDAMTFGLSAVIIEVWVKSRPAASQEIFRAPSFWRITRDGAKLVFGNKTLRTLVLFGWLAGFYVLPEGLAVPYAHALSGGTMTVGLLMAAMPTGAVIGAVVLGRLIKVPDRLRSIGWLAILSCAPLIGSAASPPLGVVLALWVLSGFGSGYQLAAVTAFVWNTMPEDRSRAFSLAQSGLLAAQGLAILAGGSVAQAIGPERVVAISGAAGLASAMFLAMCWTRLRGPVISQARGRAEKNAAASQAQLAQLRDDQPGVTL